MTKHHKEFHKLGFCFTDVGAEHLEVQKIDSPDDWKEDYEYDFDIPLLESDDEAKKIAEGMGYKFITDTYQCTNIN